MRLNSRSAVRFKNSFEFELHIGSTSDPIKYIPTCLKLSEYEGVGKIVSNAEQLRRDILRTIPSNVMQI